MSLGDCLPLALADMFDCTIIIYSSDSSTPVYDIIPSIEKIINLAYLAIRGFEQYEFVLKIDKL